jgi:hypothetical protein
VTRVTPGLTEPSAHPGTPTNAIDAGHQEPPSAGQKGGVPTLTPLPRTRSATTFRDARSSPTDGSERFAIYNTPEHIITIDASQHFIDDIRKELTQGYGFVPFIGAGMSAPSGAPLVSELHHYLHACIAMALGIEQSKKRPWNPRTDQWPPFAIRSRFTEDDWLMKVREEYARRREAGWSPEQRVFQEAIGALSEWRGALVFLSRIVREVREPNGEETYVLALDAPDAEVIDSGIRRAMRGRQPTLGHRMLATLATLLRLDIILTTNFDDLLETAFKDERNPLSVFEVHMASSLPPWSALEDQRSLVKMHGNLYSLRVDYTLDALPVEADRWRFLEYLLAPKERLRLADDLRRGALTGRNFEHGGHLLVMGAAASERRTRAFIEHACRHLEEGFKVFWLCYTMDDLEAVKKFSREAQAKPGTFRILRHPDYGLLFTELYQTIRQGIPTSGIIYPAASRLSIPPMPRAEGAGGSERVDAAKKAVDAAKEASDLYSKRIKERLDQIQTAGFQYHKLIVATSKGYDTAPERRAQEPDAEPLPMTGITTACAKVFEEVRVKQSAIWLDMNDVSSTDDLFEQLLDAVNYRIGQTSPLPVYVRKFPEVQAEEIIGLVNDTNRKWVFFLNARETPGTNLIDERDEHRDEERPNNWLDDPISEGSQSATRTDDDSNTSERFLRFITRLCGSNSPLISVVLLCRQKSDGTKSGLVKEIEAEQLQASIVELHKDCSEAREVEAVNSVLRWAQAQSSVIEEQAQRRRFLQALFSLQRTRYLATIWSGACGGRKLAARDAHDQDIASGWIKELEDLGLVRRKPGGFIWIHSRTRTAFRRALFNPDSFRSSYRDSAGQPNVQEFDTLLREWGPWEKAPEIHWELAHWYRRILAASRSPAAVFEALYHACRSAEELIRSATPPQDERVKAAVDRLKWASSLLQAYAFLVQTQGYSRGSCRRLGDIRKRRCDVIDAVVRQTLADHPDRDNLVATVERATRRLRIRCTETMRAIAREVGEDRLAYNRQTELRTLFSGESLDATNTSGSEATKKILELMAAQNAQADQRPQSGGMWIEWMRWWRWNGMLGIASRSYVAARRSLLRAALSVTDQGPERWATIVASLDDYAPRAENRQSNPPDPSERIINVIRTLADACEGQPSVLGHPVPVANRQRLRVEVARLVEQIVALEMQEVSLVAKCNTTGVKDRYRRIVDWVNVAKRVVESIRTNDHSADSHDTILALWCHSRLLMHEGLCQGRLNRADEAMVFLADAEATLDLHDPRRRNADLAIIELHRAEVRLTQANDTEIRWFDGRTVPFRELHLCFQKAALDNSKWRGKGNALRHSIAGQNADRVIPLRTARSLVQDGFSYLDRADRTLSIRRRNVGWTTWFFQRKLSAIAMSLWATVLERGTPIPFLGLEAAPRQCPTVADRILGDAQRMIRIDAYRLATIVEAYLRCIKGFFMRIYLERPSDTLADRQADMVHRLETATSRLEETLTERKKNDIWNKPEGAEVDEWKQQDNDLDPRIVRYVEKTIADAKAVSRQLSMPLR